MPADVKGFCMINLDAIRQHMKLYFASNPLCDKEMLQALSKDKSFEVRYYICNNISTPDYVLKELFAEEELRLYILKHPNCPAMLKVFA
jgi:hypothetical protein